MSKRERKKRRKFGIVDFVVTYCGDLNQIVVAYVVYKLDDKDDVILIEVNFLKLIKFKTIDWNISMMAPKYPLYTQGV